MVTMTVKGKKYNYRPVLFNESYEKLYNYVYNAGLTDLSFPAFVKSAFLDSINNSRIGGVVGAVGDIPLEPADNSNNDEGVLNDEN
jgi:hypothetical protein